MSDMADPGAEHAPSESLSASLSLEKVEASSPRQKRLRLVHRIREEQLTIEARAQELGLDFYPIVYQLVDFDQVSVIAARDGFPTRYPHWRFGQQYRAMSERSRYGLQKIYEMVINSDPTYAYLLDTNSMADHRFVIAHVCGHADFFKNNLFFAHTNRKSIDMMGNHASRVHGYIEMHGHEAVEQFIDACLSIDDLIDPYSVFRTTGPSGQEQDETVTTPKSSRPVKWFMKSYLNPEQKRESEEETPRVRKRVPESPERDILKFLETHAPLEDWQKDILALIREESYYFLPQLQTKIMNEGWASYWHFTLMSKELPDPRTIVEMASVHGGVLARSRESLNPYLLGFLLFQDIEERWNKGQFGPEWEACTDREKRKRWDKNLGLGREKIFEVRRRYNDFQFISEFLTPEFCEKHKFFVYSEAPYTGDLVIRTREFEEVKSRVLQSLHNGGKPVLRAMNANFHNRGELLLDHEHDGIGLDVPRAQATLTNLFTIWGRPVHVRTIDKEKKILLSFDGRTHNQREISDKEFEQP